MVLCGLGLVLVWFWGVIVTITARQPQVVFWLCSPPSCLLKRLPLRLFHGGAEDELPAERTALGPPQIVVFLLRFTAFRLLIGAGMSKIGQNASDCWFDFTCTTTHYFTQPIPSPLAYYFHFLPTFLHQLEGFITFVVELVCPFFFLAPHRGLRIGAGVGAVFLQVMILLTGSYAHINYLGMLPAFACFDDQFFEGIMSPSTCAARKNADAADSRSVQGDAENDPGSGVVPVG